MKGSDGIQQRIWGLDHSYKLKEGSGGDVEDPDSPQIVRNLFILWLLATSFMNYVAMYSHYKIQATNSFFYTKYKTIVSISSDHQHL